MQLCSQDKTIESLGTVQPPEGVSIDLAKWLNGDAKYSYAEWLQRMPGKKSEAQQNKPLKKVINIDRLESPYSE